MKISSLRNKISCIQHCRNKSRQFCGGFVLLELLIAMVVLITTFAAVTLISFGTQNFITDSEISIQAIEKARHALYEIENVSWNNFDQVNSTTSIDFSDGVIYNKKISVTSESDVAIKKVTADVFWRNGGGRLQHSSIMKLVTDFRRSLGNDTCSSNLSGDWTEPHLISYDLATLVNIPGAGFTIGGINAYMGKLYVTVKNTTNKTDPTFFIFDITNKEVPVLLSQIDDSVTTVAGLGGLDVGRDQVTGKTFAYVVSVRPVSGSSTFGQLQIFDVSDPASPFLHSFLKISDAISYNTSQSVGNSIFYKDGLVYLGLTKTGDGPEFNIIDVHNRIEPLTMLSRVGMFNLSSTIHSIKIKNNFVYLATTDDQELKILDISNYANPWLIFGSGYDAPDSVGSGRSLALVGDRIYLGRTFTSGRPEFYILNNSDPTNLQNNNLNPDTKEIGSSVVGLIVRDYLVFILTSTSGQFQILDMSNSGSITSYADSLILPNGGTGAVLDCEGNYFYMGSNDDSGRGAISIITSSATL